MNIFINYDLTSCGSMSQRFVKMLTIEGDIGIVLNKVFVVNNCLFFKIWLTHLLSLM